ncbi:CubicO group peptidase (beta-lactamase class C family) [Larkinella arboricola]|uniref:CubicO group peptidase (Beta-lactamase class C family) n=1 Tax=Larkinella arboricola TaxID=643671 RepID=A0A327X339_LARAB|nr:serine hydrolase [Larkinella arboricola]RAJ99984.1 CubicO group peptidase (beta-lactamase class C family) [Larkinella arboricola]
MKVYWWSLLWLLTGSLVFAQNHTGNLRTLAAIKEAEKQLVLLNNQSGLVPLSDLREVRIASVHCGYGFPAVFDSIASNYAPATGFSPGPAPDDSAFFALHDRLKLYNLILITLSDSSPFSPGLLNFIKEQQATNRVLVVLTGSGKNLAFLDPLTVPVIWSPVNTAEGASAAAQVIFGGIGCSSRLPATYSKQFKQGSGFTTQKTRLGYSVPEAVAVNSDRLTAIDSLVKISIARHVTPGAVILLAKDGQVIFHKAYGHHTYSKEEVTKLDDIFDLASVTKVSATTPAIMRLVDQKRVDLNALISRYVAQTRLIPDKATLTVREALLHEAGFTPYIKFYEQLKPLDLSADSSADFPTKVADRYFLRKNYFEEVMWPVTLKSKVETRGRFVYSDVSMYMMKEVIETASHQKLDDFVLNELYRPLGLQATGFLPRHRFPRSRIVPTTENDNWFRNMRVQGYVNDPGAAMAGGVEGHAGLFGNANDLAILYQMYLNKGTYGGIRYIEPATVTLFTSEQSAASGRGYGFARATKPLTKPYPSAQAYGHSGYTGTYVWVDPQYNMVYICLTNRVYPDDGKTYGKPALNLRSLALDKFYEAVLAGN